MALGNNTSIRWNRDGSRTNTRECLSSRSRKNPIPEHELPEPGRHPSRYRAITNQARRNYIAASLNELSGSSRVLLYREQSPMLRSQAIACQRTYSVFHLPTRVLSYRGYVRQCFAALALHMADSV